MYIFHRVTFTMDSLRGFLSRVPHGRLRTFLRRWYFKYSIQDRESWSEPEPLKHHGQELTLRIESDVDRGLLIGSQPTSSLTRLPREIKDQI